MPQFKTKKSQARKSRAPKRSARQMIDNYNPATMQVISSHPVATREETEEAVQRAAAAQKSWAALSLKQRSKLLKQFRKETAKAQDELTETICNETGKTTMDGRLEVFTVCEHIDYFQKAGPKVLKPKKRKTGYFKNKGAYTNFKPKGVIGVISPWNYPFVLTAGPVVQGLMAGNAVIVKPSEVTPDTTLKLREIATRAGIPEDVFIVLTGDGTTGQALVESSGTNMICFTGSTATGRKIGELCGRLLKPVILELGGKDPMIVFKDADLDRAAHGALWGGFSNSGQTCISVERILVEESVHDIFVEKLRKYTSELKQGLRHENPSIGSMTFPKQVKIVEDHLSDAEKNGATFALRGRKDPARDGLFFQPSVVTGVTPGMKIWQEETFGPMIAVMKFKDEQEALRLANGTSYGLNASVWTKDKKKAHRVAYGLESGSCCINDVESNYIISDLPFGGVKESGIGRVYGEEGLRNFTNIQSVLTDRLGLKKEIWWFPYTEKAHNLMRRLVSILFG